MPETRIYPKRKLAGLHRRSPLSKSSGEERPRMFNYWDKHDLLWVKTRERELRKAVEESLY